MVKLSDIEYQAILDNEKRAVNELSRMRAELAEAREWKEKWETCEKWRKFYQEAKGKLYAMGGEVAEACWNNMPCNESQVDQWFRAEFVYKAAYDRVSSELAEARRNGEQYRQNWLSLQAATGEDCQLRALEVIREARKDGERYRYIRTEAMIDYCTGTKRHNRISWPTIYAAAPVDGGNYRDRFDAAIDAARGTR